MTVRYTDCIIGSKYARSIHPLFNFISQTSIKISETSDSPYGSYTG